MSFRLFIRGRDDFEAVPVANLANPLIQDPPISGLAELATYYERPDPLVWLRKFIGTDTVPVTAVRDAAHEADVPWLSVISLKDDWLIEQKSMDQLYWKFPKHDWKKP